MTHWIIQNEIVVRLSCFFGVFAVMAIWELVVPRRKIQISKWQRWTSNIGLAFLNTIIIRLLFPAAAVGAALFASQNHWGLFNYYTAPFWLAVVVSVIALDLIIYLQHVMVHSIPMLWRVHRVHHADLDYDVTTGARFHPFEIVLSLLIKFASIFLLGAPVIAVILFEVILNATSMFNHSNIRLPLPLDRVLRWFIVTPDMHRVHHSVEDDETNSNFGFNLTWWDRLFGTYRRRPRATYETMTIGIHQFRDAKQVCQLPGMLWLPFVGKVTAYAINRRQWNPKDEP